MNEDLKRVFKQSSSVTFISGKRDSGKTDFSLLLLEEGKKEGFFSHIASNIGTRNDPNITYIGYFDRLENWLKSPGKKAFSLDELGIHLNRMQFMTKKSFLILKVCQLVRKYDAHLIGIAPSDEYINRHFMDNEILDCYIKKTSKKSCVIKNRVTMKTYRLSGIPRTNIAFITKDIAIFEERDPNPTKQELEEIPFSQKVLLLYGKYHTTRAVGKILGVSHVTISNYLKKAWEESKLNASVSVN